MLRFFLSVLMHTQIVSTFLKTRPVPIDMAQWPASWKRVTFKEYTRFEAIELPPPDVLNVPLGSVLRNRNSTRTFSSHVPIEAASLSTVLYYTAGINHQRSGPFGSEHSVRHYPSGGALYPLEVYVHIRTVKGLEPGLYHYRVSDHRLERLTEKENMDILESIYPWAKESAAQIIVTALWERNFQKYGDYGYPMVLIEAGHMMQNLQLASEACALKYCSYYGFNAPVIEKELAIHHTDAEHVLYVASIGV